MPEDTAVSEPVTAVPVAETPPPVVAPETSATASPETEAAAAPETRATLDEILAGTADEELLNHAKVKDILAREKESARRSEEARQARQFRQKAAQWAPQALGYIANEVKQAADTGRDPDPRSIQNALAWYQQGEAELQYRAHKTALMEFAPPATSEQFDSLENRYLAGKIDEAQFWKDAYDLGFKARLQKELPKLQKEWEAEYKKRQAVNAEAEQVISGDRDFRSQPRPSGGAGMTPTAMNAGAVLSSPSSTPDQKQAAFRAKYGFDI